MTGAVEAGTNDQCLRSASDFVASWGSEAISVSIAESSPPSARDEIGVRDA